MKLKGQYGEDLAVDFLEKKGFIVLHRNFRSGAAEIDIIVQKADLVVFVEVKLRSSTQFGFPEEAVNQAKQRRIVKAADQYLYQHKIELPIRFDIIAIIQKNEIFEITHFEDAFY